MANRIREIRILRCINATDVATMAGITKQRYSYIEVKGRIRNMTERRIRGIASALNCCVYDLADITDYLLAEPKTLEEMNELISRLEKERDAKFKDR